jgi:hypothetical protein
VKPLAVLRGIRLALAASVALALLVPFFGALFAAMAWDAVAGRVRRAMSRRRPSDWTPIGVPPASSPSRATPASREPG